MGRFVVSQHPLAGLMLIERRPLKDERGEFTRLYDATELGAAGFSGSPVQVNHSLTRQAATLRGMHFQHPPHAEGKLVMCLRGSVFDVAVDLRAGSPTLLRWHGEVLSADNYRALFIPPGFAHGFQTLEPDCELVYLHTAPYVPESEGGLHPLDGRLGIPWPLPIGPMSPRDRGHPLIKDDFRGIEP